MHFDVIIIGMGLSGLMAAKTAVEMGKKVLIIGKGLGTLSIFSNTVDILGILPPTTKMKDGLSQWIKDHPDHPYGKVGLEKIDESLSAFITLFPPPYSFQAIGETNCFIPTGAGTLRPAYLIPATMMAGESLKGGDGLIVGFKGFKDFFATQVAKPFKCRGLMVSLPDSSHQEITATALSRLMEKPSFRKTLSMEVKKNMNNESRVGFPAILGIHQPIEVKKDLEERMGVQVFEIPILPPSIPGMRIFNRFKAWLIQRGATFLLGHSVSKTILKGKYCKGIEVLHAPVVNSYSADRYILATGRFIGGGLKADQEKISEPLLGLSVFQPPSRQGWFEKTFFSDQPHPIHHAGALIDPSFRPVDEKGELLLENLWVAGTMLAHHHCTDEKSREGIEITTGYMAAQKALET